MTKFQKTVFLFVFAFIFYSASLVVGSEPDFIDKMILQLGNNSYNLREEASKNIEARMDFDLCKKLLETKKKSKDLEVTRRIGRITDDYLSKLNLEFKINFKVYPEYPFTDAPFIDRGMPEDYKLDGPWQGWSKQDFVRHYLNLAYAFGALQDSHFCWTYECKATELLMQERISYDLQKAIEDCNNEKEFRYKMKKCIGK